MCVNTTHRSAYSRSDVLMSIPRLLAADIYIINGSAVHRTAAIADGASHTAGGRELHFVAGTIGHRVVVIVVVAIFDTAIVDPLAVDEQLPLTKGIALR